MNLLFICSRNKWRSHTAETIYKNRQGIVVQSAGTEPSARIRLSAKHIEWADIIFCMEQKHKQRMAENFPGGIHGKNIIVLHIPDVYQYMDEELIEMLNNAVEEYL